MYRYDATPLKAPCDTFCFIDMRDSVDVSNKAHESCSYLTIGTAAALKKHLPNMDVISCGSVVYYEL